MNEDLKLLVNSVESLMVTNHAQFKLIEGLMEWQNNTDQCLLLLSGFLRLPEGSEKDAALSNLDDTLRKLADYSTVQTGKFKSQFTRLVAAHDQMMAAFENLKEIWGDEPPVDQQ